MNIVWMLAAVPIATLSLGVAPPTRPNVAPTEVGDLPAARAFPHEDGIVDLLVTGPAAAALYQRLPGKGAPQACGASGLYKGDGSLSCVADGDRHSCHIWIDATRQALAPPEEDDC